jgi:hypothetical protein
MTAGRLPHDNNPLKAARVKNVHNYRDVSGHNASLTATPTTIETLLGVAIADNIGRIDVWNVGQGVLFIEPAGTAGADSFPVPPGEKYPLMGRADELRLVQLFACPNTDIGLMYKKVYQ